jgi:hypothetical protein
MSQPLHDFATSQFTMLAIDVAMAAYVGTVARGVATQIGLQLKSNEPPSGHLQLILFSLIVADILLIFIAGALALRIYRYSNDWEINPGIDRFIGGAIACAIGYMSLLHILQWCYWLARIAGYSEMKETTPGLPVGKGVKVVHSGEGSPAIGELRLSADKQFIGVMFGGKTHWLNRSQVVSIHEELANG